MVVQQALFHTFTPQHRAARPEKGPQDVFTPGPGTDLGIYKPMRESDSQKLARLAWKQLAVIEPPDDQPARCRDELHQIGAKGKAFQIRERHRVLGDPRLNRPYPDPDLEKAGVAQELPMDVTTNFKWLMSEPLVMGQKQDIVLLPTQYEGGPTWLGDGEYECRDQFIAVKKDPESGRYKEIGSVMTRKPGWQDVYRSIGRTEVVPGTTDRFAVHIEGGTYTWMGIEDTLLYQVTDDGIQQIGEWKGHIPFDQLDAHPQKERKDWHRFEC